MSERKIVQIAVATAEDRDYESLFALCNDGTVWDFSYKYQSWSSIPNIPQPVEAPTDA